MWLKDLTASVHFKRLSPVCTLAGWTGCTDWWKAWSYSLFSQEILSAYIMAELHLQLSAFTSGLQKCSIWEAFWDGTMLKLRLHPAPGSQNSEPLWDSICFCMKTICLIAELWFTWYISSWSLHPKTSNLENQGSSHMYLSSFMLWDCSSSSMLCVGINALLSRFFIHSEINRKSPWEYRENKF